MLESAANARSLRRGLGLFVCVLMSCSRDLSVAPEPGFVVPARALAPTSIADLSPETVFDISIRVDGRLVPGSTVLVTAAVTTRMSLPAATIRIDAPEIDAARESAWGEGFRVRVGEKLRAASMTSRSMAAGGVHVQTALLQAEQPGLYRVVISAIAPPATRTSVPRQTSESREVWLLVDGTGGRVLTEFDASVIPPEMVPQPGPFRKRPVRGAQASAVAPNGSSARPLAAMTSDGFDHYRVVYYDTDSSAYAGLPGVSVQYNVYTDDDYGNSPITDTGGSGSDNNGSVIIDCSYLSSNQRYDGTLRLTNGLLTIDNADQFWGVSGTGGYSNCGMYMTDASPYQIIAPSADKARVFAVLTRGINQSRSFFGASRTGVAVKVLSSVGQANYSSWNDEITIYSNSVWSSWGRFTALHEYGHALMEKGLGGNAASGNCPLNHYFDAATNLKCAFSEGFADYHAQALGAGYFYYGGDYTYGCTTYTTSAPAYCTAYATTRDGSIVEGAVAVYLSHVTDAINSPHDSVSYPGSYVASVINTCRLNVGWLVQIDGADFMSYCLQSSFSGSTSFLTRNSSGTTIYSNPATKPGTWSAASVNQLWKWDLFRQ